MKKFIFSIFAICISAPSFGNCVAINNNSNTDDTSKFIPSIINPNKYLICDNTKEDSCSPNDKVFNPQDGNIYDCTSIGWKILDEKKINQCKGGLDDILAKDQDIRREPDDFSNNYDIAKKDHRNFVYLYKQYANNIKTETLEKFCKLDINLCYDKEDEYHLEGGQFTSSNFSAKYSSDLFNFYVLDHDGNFITNAVITYPDLNLEKNRQQNIAKVNKNYRGAPYYSIKTTSGALDNINISANGYKTLETSISKIKQAQLSSGRNHYYAILEPNDGSISHNTQTLNVAQAIETYKIVNSNTNAPISNVTIYTNNKGNPGNQVATSDQNGNFTLDNTNAVKGGVVLVHDGYKRTIYTYKNFPINGVFSMTPCSTTSRNTPTPQTTQLQYDKCETVYVLPSISPEPLPVCNNDPEKIIRAQTQTIHQLEPIYNTEIISTQPNNTAEAACTYTGGTYTNGQCTCDLDNKHLVAYTGSENREICRCADGYHRTGDPVCINENEIPVYEATGPCIPANDYEIQIVPDKIGMQRDAEAAYRNEYDNAQSWANKGTTALSTLMTGEGAMMAARAIAEKIADDDAEREMAEYVSTMKCEYGGGQSVKLGDTETLPGGNELANYYAEYKQLADKLKATKTALNLRPGIEAEVLYDRAETGLYQYQTAERQSGGFTSLSRALMNPDGTDAEQWNAQRAETNRDLLIGGALATVGLAGSYIANRAINKDHVKKYKELEEKFMEIKIQLEHEYPEIFIPTKAEPVVVIEPESPVIVVEVPLTASEKTFDKDVDKTTFESGFMTLTKSGVDALKAAVSDVVHSIEDFATVDKINIIATGHTDPTKINPQWVSKLTKQYIDNIGPLPDDYNNKIDDNPKLSKARAKMVTKFLTEQFKESYPNVQITEEATGKGDADCTNKKPSEYSQCRKVEISIKVTGTTTESE